jgi:predicted HTH domain antitoxin
MTLLRAGDISIGKAAEIAGMSYMDFLPLVKALGMYVVDYDPAELADELKLLGG